MRFEQERIILDACCVLTLYASGRMAGVLRAMPVPVTACQYVLKEEVLYTYTGPESDPRSVQEQIDLSPFLASGLIEAVNLEGNAEMEAFVRLATQLDDGEAQTLAIAINRNWAIATDEKKSARVASAISPPVRIVTTPELIKWWAETEMAPREEIRQVLRSVRRRSLFFPGRSHRLLEWWNSHYGDDE